jgi:hypothetical protein
MNPEDENVLPFITELKNKITHPGTLCGSTTFPADLSSHFYGGGGGTRSPPPGPVLPPAPSFPGPGASCGPSGGAFGGLGCGGEGARSTGSMGKLEGLSGRPMPFELKALEVCLDSVSWLGAGCKTSQFIKPYLQLFQVKMEAVAQPEGAGPAACNPSCGPQGAERRAPGAAGSPLARQPARLR